MKRQLENLTCILKHIDPALYNYLETKESGNLYFCFRWLLIWFKREFSFPDTCSLWEALWTKMWASFMNTNNHNKMWQRALHECSCILIIIIKIIIVIIIIYHISDHQHLIMISKCLQALQKLSPSRLCGSSGYGEISSECGVDWHCWFISLGSFNVS